MNYELKADEVILCEEVVSYSEIKGSLQMILTSKKIVLEKEKGIIKKQKELIDIIKLEDIKIYNEKAQVHQKGAEVNIQTVSKNIKITFDGIIKANKFVIKIVDTITDTTMTQRSTNKIKDAINVVDDVLGMDTRETIKGVMENGVVNSLLKGIKKK